MRDAALHAETRIVTLNAHSWLAHRHRRTCAGRGTSTRWSTCSSAPIGWTSGTTRRRPTGCPACPAWREPLLRHAERSCASRATTRSRSARSRSLAQAWCALFQGQPRRSRATSASARARTPPGPATRGPSVGHLLALASFRRVVLGRRATRARACARAPSRLLGGYGEWGRYVLLVLVARVAAIGEDVARCARRCDRSTCRGAHRRAKPPSARACRRSPPARVARGPHDDAIARWREALAHEEAIDLLGQASETRVRLARALLRTGEVAQAARTLEPVFVRAAEDDGPGGALFARRAARLAAAWRDVARGRHADGSLRDWCSARRCARGRRCSATAGTGPGDSAARRPVAARARRAAPDRRGRQQQAHRARVRPEPAHGQAPRREHPGQARRRHPRPGRGLVPAADAPAPAPRPAAVARPAPWLPAWLPRRARWLLRRCGARSVAETSTVRVGCRRRTEPPHATLLTIFGATGAQGGGLARAILADPPRRFRVRAVTRKPAVAAARVLARPAPTSSPPTSTIPRASSARWTARTAAFCVTNFWEHLSPEREIVQAHAMARPRRAPVSRT